MGGGNSVVGAREGNSGVSAGRGDSGGVTGAVDGVGGVGGGNSGGVTGVGDGVGGVGGSNSGGVTGAGDSEGVTGVGDGEGGGGGGNSGGVAGAGDGVGGVGGEQAGWAVNTDSDCGRSFSAAEWSDCSSDSGKEGQCLDGGTDTSAVPICTSPTPRPPLQPLATPQEGEVGGAASDTKDDGSALALPSLRDSTRAPPTCCPALLLDGTDLSSYGAKISKMRDGFLGSALDLIKKR